MIQLQYLNWDTEENAGSLYLMPSHIVAIYYEKFKFKIPRCVIQLVNGREFLMADKFANVVETCSRFV